MAAAQCLGPSTSAANVFPVENFELNYKMLKPLDEALRCRICFDYYNSCMMTKCNHNYCSVCIRRYMTYKSQCPTCFQEAAEPELQNNRLIDEIVRLFKKLRCIDDENARPVLKTPVTPARPLCVSESSSDSQSTSQSTSTMSSNVDEPFTPRVKIEIPDEKNIHISVKKELDFDEVTCPVCYNAVLADRINVHLDSCLKQQFDESERRKTLPKLVYHLLTEKEIKMKLKEHGLPVSGDRQALIKRHKSFITLYNANCDSLNPKPASELVKEVELQELEERINSLPKEIQVNKKSDLAIIEEQHQSYIKRHQSQFNALINDVHQRQFAQIHIKKEKEDTSYKNISVKTEYVPIKTELDSNQSIQIEENSEFGPNAESISSSSSDSSDVKKSASKLHHKRKKDPLSQND